MRPAACLLAVALVSGPAAPAGANALRPDDALAHAIRLGDLAGIDAALAAGADLDGEPGASTTPVELASRLGRRDALLRLLERGAPLRIFPTTFLAASAAAEGGHVEVLAVLLARAELRDPQRQLHSSLRAAIGAGQREAAGLLLDRGASLDAEWRCEDPLGWALVRGHVDVARLLLERGARPRVLPDCKGYVVEGVPAVEAAAALGDASLVRELLALAPAGDPTSLYAPAAAQAAYAGHAEILEVLLRLGVDPDARATILVYDVEGGWSRSGPLLAHAAARGHFALVRTLLRTGADPEAAYLFHHAARWGAVPILEELLERGLDVQQVGPAEESDFDEFLPIECGNALTAIGHRPRAADPELLRAARVLLEHGIDPDVPCGGRRTVYWAREKNRRAELAAGLAELGAGDGVSVRYVLRQAVRGVTTGVLVVVFLVLGPPG